MVRVLIADIFQSKAQTIVNTVNCVGIMGKGIALEFKRRYPEMFKDYEDRCKRGEVRLGEPYLYRTLFPPWIINFPTKDHWRSISNLKDIIRGLDYLLKHYKEWDVTSIAVPPLGCGAGHLEWRIVGPTLYRYMAKMDIPVELYAPHGTPHEELRPEFLGRIDDVRMENTEMPVPQWVRPAWIALVEILYRIEQQPYHWPVGRTTLQKIAFVSTMEGLPTNLAFSKGSYGPFSPRLKEMITRLVNHGLINEEKLGRMFEVKVGRTFTDARKAYEKDLTKWDAVIDKTVDLFVRMNTQQAEIVSTVLFAEKELTRNGKEKPDENDVLSYVLQWKQKRRPALDTAEIANTIRNLAVLKWLHVRPSSDMPLPDSTWM
ncbi:MAG: Appr-1-p processing protein [Syntrophobacterales bacterium CG_4_8_14_3_um_filter_58_8]|nr:MAG: Appr-1-p processing protein [Syntrophaceae bacterium CG2_30_58_14]PIV00931.1 MAG: Appr-1-p processing protein [Syntrophobacterales bacterium CG03_land_8_20_14_0_80_58_14]PJC71956.1 MAG: Appr-1-p processing protein [Syntrophobacterales bacterium CG_4_8_14_3_um_filter_58_8]